jgi:hypothetical protein
MNTIAKPSQLQPPISEQERERRREGIEYARASVGLEGFVWDDETEALFTRYVDGELTRPELNEAVLKLAAAHVK